MQLSIELILTQNMTMCRRLSHFLAMWVAGFALAGGTCGALIDVLDEPTAGGQQATEDQRPIDLPTGINDGFLDPKMDPEEYIKRFEVESREVFACRHKILEALELTTGQRVGDIGAGTGLFLKSLSESVGVNGKVYAVEISPSFIKHLRVRARNEGLENVEVVFCSERHSNLQAESVDRIFICDVYHHFEFPLATMNSLFEAMSEGGLLVLVDFHREPKGVSPDRREWLLGHVRAPQETFRDEIEKAGFQFKDEISIDGFQENYLLRFVKPLRSNAEKTK